MISREAPLLLASASPRRKELLDLAGVPHVVRATDTDESVRDGEEALAYVARVARSKAEAAMSRGHAGIVLAADTAVIVDGRVLGKPASDEDGRAMLRALSDRGHDVATAFVVGDASTERILAERVVVTRVVFRALDARDIDAYVATGEGRDKAGGYAIQGHAGAFVLRVEGSPTNVIGLPTAEVVLELRRLGLLP